MKRAAQPPTSPQQELPTALRRVIRWPEVHRFLGRDEINEWGMRAAESAFDPRTMPGLDVEVFLWLAEREAHWHWLGVAVLSAASTRAFGGGGAQIGKKTLRRLAKAPGKKLITVGKAVAHIDYSLKSGIAPSEVDFSGFQGLASWQSDALRYALVLLAHSSKAPTTYSRVNSSSGSKRPLPSLSFHIPRPGAQTHGPDLPLEDLYDEPALVRAPDGSDGEADERAPSGSLIYERWLAEGCYTLHLSGALLPGTERTFAKGEVLRLVEALAATIADSQATEQIRLCALAYALALLTSRSRKSAVGAMARLAAQPNDQTDNWLTPEAFRVQVPHHHAFGKPAPKSLASLLPTSIEFWLPLPISIRSVLTDLGRFDPGAWKLSEPGWNAHFELLKQRLAAAAPRLSEARIRHVMPVAIWVKSADIVRTQIISGQLLDHPSAALHYYAFSVRELVESYVAGIRDWLPDDWAVVLPKYEATDEALIGAPNAAIRDESLRSSISIFRQNLRGRPKGIDELIDSYNSLVSYTVAMLAAATTHRLTFHLGLIQLDDFILDLPDQQDVRDPHGKSSGCALTVFVDKLTDNGSVFRVAAVPPVLKEQILALLAAIRRVSEILESIPGGRGASEGLKQIEQGSTSLFKLIEKRQDKGHRDGYRLRRFRRRDLRRLWPEFPIPFEHLRHRFTTIARRNKLAPDDIRRQMGHSVDALPFGPTDPDSAMDFALRISGPIDAALREDGWEPLRMDTHGAAGWTMPVMSCADVVEFERKILAHADLRSARFRRLVENERDQRRDDIIAVVKQLSLQPHEADAESRPPGVHTAAEARRVSDQLARCCGESAMQPEMSKVLRTWARVQRKEGRWSAPLPGMCFRRSVDAPLITPATARAYAAADNLLAWAEAQDVTCEEHGKTASPRLLVLAVVELSIRGGLTSEDRLIRCVRGLSGPHQYGKKSDQVVVNLGQVDHRDEVPSDPIEAQDKNDEVPEGMLLAGIPALLSLAWQSRGINASALKLEDLNAACESQVPKALLGEIDAQSSVLSTILHVASLARRLTQPGLRSAWEEGRIVSRSLDPARASELRSHDWFGPDTNEEPDGSTSQTEREPNVAAATVDAVFLRWVRGCLHQRLRAKGAARSYVRIANEIESRLAKEKACGGTAAVFVRLLMRWLRRRDDSKRLRLRTIYTYLVSILEPVLFQIGTMDLIRLDADTLEDVITRTVMSKRAKNRPRTLRVMQELLAEIAALGGTQLEPQALADLLPTLVAPATPYLNTGREQMNAPIQVRHWKEHATAHFSDMVGAGPDHMNARDCDGALRLLMCSRHGLRAGEGLSRRREDFIDTPGCMTLLVRPRRSDPLKTLASNRAIELHDLSADEGQEIRRWLSADESTTSQAGRARKSRGSRLPRELGSEQAISVARAALSMVARGDASRLHAGRHTIGCAGLVTMMPRYLSAELYCGLEARGFLAQVSALPASIQIQALARVLGQATPLTTLTHYVHLIGYLEGSDRGWRLPTTRGIAAVTLVRHGALRTRLSRAGIGISESNASGLGELLRLKAPPIHNRNSPREFVPVSSPPIVAKISRPEGIHQAVGAVLLGIASGESRSALMAAHGISGDRLDLVVNEALVLQEQYSYRIVRRNGANAVENARRIPRIIAASELLKRCDQQAIERPQLWKGFVSALERQSRLDGLLRVPRSQLSDHLPVLVEQILGQRVQTRVLEDGRLELDHDIRFAAGAVNGRSRAPISFAYFVVLLCQRLRGQNR